MNLPESLPSSGTPGLAALAAKPAVLRRAASLAGPGGAHQRDQVRRLFLCERHDPLSPRLGDRGDHRPGRGGAASPGPGPGPEGQLRARDHRRPPPTTLDVLTGREREVLALVARGWSNAEITERLYLSPATAKTHVGRLLTKLQARDRTQLVVIAYETGLVTPSGPAVLE